ncbi:MAG: tRNA (adenosine(37)-N6)-threonylcarbamoyltransferase complex transferase subunit TsaD [Bacteroidetes bacterium]|nr:tRNA (adenosine(37)-N6)-threonylcarbamoyltransferase complex transferase subunit TsaD [Bacteroidota bacterium]
MPVRILAIESSCDETAAAVCIDGCIISNIVAGQKVHEQYGGVVPELASRAHMQHIVPVVDTALKNAGICMAEINAVGYTQSPGLIGSLLVGGQFAKSLALSQNIPLIAVHHMQAHVLANLIDTPKPAFPFLCLTVSGGHTQIIQCNSPLSMKVIGETIDDAAGEAFDKSAKLLGLPYPGGPLIDQHAQNGNGKRFNFPKPHVEGLDFSFSGLKTSIVYFLQQAGKSVNYKQGQQVDKIEQENFISENLSDICASIQDRIISILLDKLEKAVSQTGIQSVCLAGGVSANSGLRKEFLTLAEQKGWNAHIPSFEYCTDNAGMIAITAYYKYVENQYSNYTTPSSARANW